MPGSGANGAFVFAERLRGALAEEFAEDSVAITISFGLATYPEHTRRDRRLAYYAPPTRHSMPPRTAVATAPYATARCCVSSCK